MAGRQILNVLVVDRDAATRAELREFLTAQGYRAQVATEPAEVLGAVKRDPVPLVLLDLSPPEGESLELLGQIHRADSDVCVIGMTTAPSVEVAVRALKGGAFDYLQKPLKRDELGAVLRAAIREKGLLVDLEARLNQIVGQRMRERRGSEGLTLKQVAKRSGLSVSLISQIELGKSAASMSTLHKLATALQVKMTYFFETV